MRNLHFHKRVIHAFTVAALSLSLTLPQRSHAIIGIATANLGLTIGGATVLGTASLLPFLLGTESLESYVWSMTHLGLGPQALIGLVILPTSDQKYETKLSPIEHSSALAALGVSLEDVAEYNSNLNAFSQDAAQLGNYLIEIAGRLSSSETDRLRSELLLGYPDAVARVANAIFEINQKTLRNSHPRP